MPDVIGLYRRFGVRLPQLDDGWASCRCFTGAHQDRHPSARVHLRSGGFRCFTCGKRGGVLAALELLGVRDRQEARRLAEDYGIIDPPQRPRSTRPPPTPPPPPPKPPVERVDYDSLGDTPTLDRTWTYVDADGEPVGRVRRLDLPGGRKRIWQERPDGDRWLPGLEGKHLPLYQLPLVHAAARQHQRILVVEGEKAVDALDRVGILATTNAGGAGKWRPEHTRALAGATVLVVCDSDAPGRQHAHHVTLDLLTDGVTVLDPLDLGPSRHDGYDIVDDLTATAETIRAVTPETTDAGVRAGLHDYIRKLLGRQLPATPDTLQRWHEHAEHLADPDTTAWLPCPRCRVERVHHVSHGLAYCRCGHHQPAP